MTIRVRISVDAGFATWELDETDPTTTMSENPRDAAARLLRRAADELIHALGCAERGKS